jgi:tRNA(adenine34) deaminase
MTDEQWMDRALKEADEAYRRGDWPMAAVLVKDGAAVATGQNRQNTRNDLSCHAEREALRAAFRNLGTVDLSGTVLYSSMECCPMCAWAVKIAGLGRVVLGARHADLARTDLGTYSMETFAALMGGGPALASGVRQAECVALRQRWGKEG